MWWLRHSFAMSPALRLSIPLAVAACALVAAVPAHATLIFTRPLPNPASILDLNRTIWVANDDGSDAHLLTRGRYPRISPDGKKIAYTLMPKAVGVSSELMVVATDGDSPPRRLLPGETWRDGFAWSADSATVAATTASSGHDERLVLVNVETGARRPVAHGFFLGVSFAPEGGQLVYARARSLGPATDLFIASTASGQSVRVTGDRRSVNPLWGPTGQIAFAKWAETGSRESLFLMSPEDDAAVRPLTHTKVLSGESFRRPLSWSADGSRLLSEIGGLVLDYSVTVDVMTGATRKLTASGAKGHFFGAALSGDGRTVLGSIGPQPEEAETVVTIPYSGGKPKVLANNAAEPDWNR